MYALKLFDKTTKRHIYSQIHSFARPNRLNLVDPIKYFNQDDLTKSWTSKISSLVREKRPREAICLFKKMLVNGQIPNFVTILGVIKAVGLIGSKKLAFGIHGYSIKMGFTESEVSVVTALVGVYSNWDLRHARKLFDDAPNKDVICWSAMVLACVNCGDYMEAFKLIKGMVFSGVQPNFVTITTLLPACGDLAALKLGREIHGYSIKNMLCNHTVLQNSLVDMYCKCKHLKAAIHVFNGTLDKDLVSGRIILHGCVENNSPRKALDIFFELQSCGSEKVDEYMILDVIQAYLKLDENYFRQGFHSLVLKMGFLEYVSVMTELIQLYAKFGNIELARKLFDALNYKDLIAWTAMISVYADSTQPHNAFHILAQMQTVNQKPNEFTFVSLLLASMSLDAIEIGESIHAQITKNGYSRNAFLTSTLIDMYCKFGRTRQGRTIFDDNLTKDFICWSSMINGYGVNGCGDEVLECFSNMLSYGVVPNNVVFISVLSACSHCGLEYEGWYWFHAMETMYGIAPKLAHYACMVDMLSRRGNIEEALEFVNNMPIEPDKRIWGALLAGCRNTDGPTEILELVAKKLISLDPGNTSYYVVLSNLYATQGRWDEVEKLRNIMDTKPLKKFTGYSTI